MGDGPLQQGAIAKSVINSNLQCFERISRWIDHGAKPHRPQDDALA